LNGINNNGFEFLEFINIREEEIHNFNPIAGSYAVIKCGGKYLLCYNNWRKQWEVPAGKREQYETSKECAIRELYEETGQVVLDMEFRGLLKVKSTTNMYIKYNPIYFTTLKRLQPFIENEEISKIKLWNLNEEIQDIDSVDVKIFEYI
jgi:8-oxo-dGTP diphosphatase